MEELEKYTNSTPALECQHPAIIEKARVLTANSNSDSERAVQLFYFVRDSIHYNIYMISMFLEDFKAATVLERGKGYCVQKAVLLTTLGRSLGIPSRLAFAAIRNHKLPSHLAEKLGSNIMPRHGYTEFYLNNKWIAAAPTFDHEICRRVDVPTVEFDGVRDAVLPESDMQGNPYIEYLEKFGSSSELPLDWIVERTSKRWGTEKRAWL